jgi:hypothetical protein
MIAKIDVVNLAVLLTGAEKITSLSGNSKAVKLYNSLFELSYRGMLELPVEWGFARTWATLSETTSPTLTQFDYRYLLPSDCLRVYAVIDEYDNDMEVTYRRENYKEGANLYATILTDEDECHIRYLRDIDNVAYWPGWFCRLVGIDLAILMCEPLKQDKQKKNQLMNMMVEPSLGALPRAIAANALEDMETVDNKALKRGNTDVLDASIAQEATQTYIVTRE